MVCFSKTLVYTYNFNPEDEGGMFPQNVDTYLELQDHKASKPRISISRMLQLNSTKLGSTGAD
jgi:hypothetical protein